MNKVEQIRKERKELLELVSNNLKQNNNNLSQNIEEITKVIEFDEKNVKKYEAIVKAKEIIAELVEQIAVSKNPEEISKIRNRINYYINKIKSELKNRNISEEQMNNYINNVSAVRNDITKYIRSLKREHNLDELEVLSNKETLTDEEKDKKKKLQRNEKAFNRRYLNPKTNESKESNPKTDLHFDYPKLEVVVDEEPIYMEKKEKAQSEELVFNTPIIVDNYENSNELHLVKENVIESTALTVIPTLSELLQEKVSKYKARFRMQDTYNYGKNVLVNIGYFIKNLPIYTINKWKIDNMEEEYYNIYHSPDLGGYIEYSKKRNSIRHGLKNIFSKSYLNSKENEYLNNHNMCSQWLIDYYKENDINNIYGQYCFSR